MVEQEEGQVDDGLFVGARTSTLGALSLYESFSLALKLLSVTYPSWPCASSSVESS